MRYEATINGKRVIARLGTEALLYDANRGWSARVVLSVPLATPHLPTDVNMHQEELQSLEEANEFLTSLGFTPISDTPPGGTTAKER